MKIISTKIDVKSVKNRLLSVIEIFYILSTLFKKTTKLIIKGDNRCQVGMKLVRQKMDNIVLY